MGIAEKRKFRQNWNSFYAFAILNAFFGYMVTMTLMTTMGRLAIDLSESVKDSTDLKTSSCFCSKQSYKCKLNSIRLIYTAFIISGVTTVLFYAVEFSKENFSFNWRRLHFPTIDYKIINTAFDCLLLLFTLYYYFCMKMSLDGCTAPRKKTERIKKAFTIFYALLTCSTGFDLILGLFPYSMVIKDS